MRRYRPYFSKNKEGFWVCPNHIPSIHMPMISKTCWMCRTPRPLTEKEKEIERERIILHKKNFAIAQNLCAWKNCKEGTNGRRAKATGKSKYCSVKCKNNFARWSYRERKKEKK